MGDRRLKPGDMVEVRPPAEILGTLDEEGSVDAMPFMPEMLQHVGRRFTVSRRVEKICDTVSGGFPRSLQMHDTVLLEDLRCDGSAHGGCQAGCRLYWKEEWLRLVDPREEAVSTNGDPVVELEQLLRSGTVATRTDEGSVDSYRCQATEALRATKPLSRYDPRQYVRELTSGNMRSLRLLRVVLRAARTAIGRRLRLLSWSPLPNRGTPSPTRPDLDLRPGDAVEVLSREEIARTVGENGKTRGLSFDWEMLPYCGGRYRIKDRIERIIDETNGRMIEISSDCWVLEGVVCSGELSTCRWCCPREIYPYWRGAWLRRVDDLDEASSNWHVPADVRAS